MASKLDHKLDQARASAAAARKSVKQARLDDCLYQPAAGFLFGAAQKRGIYLPSVGGLGRHATTGLIGVAIGLRGGKGPVARAALAVGKAGLTLAAYELGATGDVIAGDDEDTADVFDG